MTARNARFWVLINCSPVKITLRPGAELNYGKRWQHEEGWSAEYYTWRHDGDAITEERGTDGRDCDGRHSTGDVWHAPLAELAGRLPGLDFVGRLERPAWDGVSWPQWQRGDAWQRDYSAELANY